MKLLVGTNSRLSRALQAELNGSALSVCSRDLSWAEDADLRYKVDTLFICGGITDPNVANDEIYQVNFEMPLRLSKIFQSARIVTFGTTLEESNIINPYVNSKRELVKSLKNQNVNSIHYRLHTLYGLDFPKAHMFLGQLYYAIKQNADFIMSSGRQFREYHHYSDVAKYIVNTFQTPKRAINCNTGKPKSLIDIATYIIEHLARDTKLIVDHSLDTTAEIFTPRECNLQFDQYQRDMISGIVSYLKALPRECR